LGKDKTGFHPTQKPIALFEYLIKTYTNEGEIVLDNTAGSCTTAIACKNLKRKWICIEQDQKYCDVSVGRIKNWEVTP
jgi:site-specific DNA-methyltransferase (adenine-specific)